MQLAARVAIKLARENNVYIVIDADGLFLVQTDPSVVKGYKRVILTPNVVEFGRLVESCVSVENERFLSFPITDVSENGLYDHRVSTRTQRGKSWPLHSLALSKDRRSFRKELKTASRTEQRRSSPKRPGPPEGVEVREMC